MNNPTSMSNIEAVLGQIRNYQAQAQDSTQKTAFGMNEVNRDSVGFGDAIKGAIQEVNSKAMESKTLRTAYEHGEDVPPAVVEFETVSRHGPHRVKDGRGDGVDLVLA